MSARMTMHPAGNPMRKRIAIARQISAVLGNGRKDLRMKSRLVYGMFGELKRAVNRDPGGTDGRR